MDSAPSDVDAIEFIEPLKEPQDASDSLPGPEATAEEEPRNGSHAPPVTTPDEGKGKAVSGLVLDMKEGQVFTMRELAEFLSKNYQHRSSQHTPYYRPNGVPFSELGLPYTVAASIVHRQLQADDLPPSRRAMRDENTDPKQGPGYISPEQLYEVRDCINGKREGIFAKVNIKKGQLILSEQPLITLYFHDRVIKWDENIALTADGPEEAGGSSSSSMLTETTTRPASPSQDNKLKPRNFIVKIAQAVSNTAMSAKAMSTKAMSTKSTSNKADRRYAQPGEDDAIVNVSELSPNGATGAGSASRYIDEDTTYTADDDIKTQIRKRLLADFKDLSETNPAETAALQRAYVDNEFRYGGDWLLRLWQRFSREIPVPGSLNPELIEPRVTTVEACTPSQCRSLFQKTSYVNHSCFPNAELKFWYDSIGRCHLELYAARDILRKDEITLFYEKWERMKRLDMCELTSRVENVFGFTCGCEPCLGGYKDRESWEARD